MKHWPLIIILSITFLMSCSLLNPQERKGSSRQKDEFVPKAQYDELLARFEELNRQHLELKEGKTPQRPEASLDNQLNDPIVDTIDVFSPEMPVMKESVGNLEDQIQKYRKAQSMESLAAADAMRTYQALAREGVLPIKARAQLRMGVMLQAQGEYDLALQAFEEIIQKMAASGIVLEALSRAVECSEKLGLSDKKAQYQSLLKDVFQVGV